MVLAILALRRPYWRARTRYRLGYQDSTLQTLLRSGVIKWIMLPPLARPRVRRVVLPIWLCAAVHYTWTPMW